ncbi:hypothetical protein SIL08_13640 [Scandinavium sp. V105_16]|uniref:Uncharacterized protein n=1 Tax=Scandinavium lactucae TaxID=3095028 RepID=A0AAJ2SAD7_9ENTR|nr:MULTISPECIES: hypothetical protein [unclassified Scandinavium]MDX6021315.1 hypothetical protein [Scandinavium sp. V105_16]MDX6032988.1 hypothetical protein [Scandinavium sp. V105_12]
MPVYKGKNATWADSVGGVLRGEQQINQLVPDHPYINTLAHMEELLTKNTRHYMLLTLEEVRGILSDLTGTADDFFSYKLGGGNIKDIWDGKNTLGKLTTYLNEADQLKFNLKGLGIQAVACKYGTETYIKITGYPSVRRILNGTRYKATNPQLLELGIGWRGVAHTVVKGIKFCVYFSLAFRAIELIFKKEYTLVDFFGDVIMDTAKTLVSSVVAVAVGGVIALFCPFIILTTALVIAVGIAINVKLNILDSDYNWSVKLKTALQEALFEEQRIHAWNNTHLGHEMTLFYNTHN